MLFSVYEEPGDAGLLQLVTVDHVSQRDISGSEDEILDRPWDRSSLCVVSCAENIGAQHTEYSQSWFFNLHVWGLYRLKKSLKIYKILMCEPPLRNK